MRTIIALAAVFALSSVAMASPVDPEEQTALQLARSSDLNLNDPSDALQMLRRIRNASREICDDRQGRMSLAERIYRKRCVRESTSESVAELGNANVTQAYEMRR